METNSKLDIASQTKELEVYSPFVLSIYDYFVLSFFCPLLWGCGKTPILNLYNKYVTTQHMDIGVGTGYFLDKCQFPNAKPNITLVDLNDSCLDYTSQRIQRYNPKTCKTDIYQPLSLNEKFNSVSMTLLLHCLPGSIQDKAKIFENITPLLSPGATLFGATVLGKNVELNFIAKKLMKVYNKHKIFCNLQDDLEGLTTALNSYFTQVEIEMRGAIALFCARYKSIPMTSFIAS